MTEQSKISLNELRKSIGRKLDALAEPAEILAEVRSVYDELETYHSLLADREKSMQGALVTLVDDMSQTSQTLMETGTRLETILESATDVAFIITNSDTGHIVEFSTGAERIFGYTKAEALGLLLDSLCPTNERFPENGVGRSPVKKMLNQRLVMRRRNCELFPAVYSLYPLKNTSGENVATLLIASDNTKEELAQRYLRETQEKYKALAVGTPASIMAFSSDGTIEFVNDWHIEVFDKGHIPVEGYVGKKIYEIPCLLRAGVAETIKEVFRGETVSIEAVRIPPFNDRKESWQNIRCAPLMVNDELIGGIIIREDITSRKQTEHDLKKIVDSSPIPLLKVEQTGEGRVIRTLNPEAVGMFGLDAIGKLEAAYISPLEGLREELPGLHGEACELQTLSGVREGIRTSHQLSGNVEVHAVMDVSVLAQAREAAEDASRAKSDFLANISHEIRTPLNVLIGMLQLFQEEELNDELSAMVGHASGAANSLLGLLTDILDFSVVEARALALDEHSFSLREIVDLIAMPYGVEAGRKGLALNVVLDDAIPERLYGDARRLRQIIFHLVGNAVKFTDAGSVDVEISFIPEPSGKGRLVMMISDTGIGFDIHDLNQLFELFRQADGSRTRRHGGTGIGLALVNEFIGAMSGSIAVYSEPDQGTEVLVVVGLSEVT